MERLGFKDILLTTGSQVVAQRERLHIVVNIIRHVHVPGPRRMICTSFTRISSRWVFMTGSTSASTAKRRDLAISVVQKLEQAQQIVILQFLDHTAPAPANPGTQGIRLRGSRAAVSLWPFLWAPLNKNPDQPYPSMVASLYMVCYGPLHARFAHQLCPSCQLTHPK